MNYQSPSFEKR